MIVSTSKTKFKFIVKNKKNDEMKLSHVALNNAFIQSNEFIIFFSKRKNVSICSVAPGRRQENERERGRRAVRVCFK